MRIAKRITTQTSGIIARLYHSSLGKLARMLVCWHDVFPFYVRARSCSYRCRAALDISVLPQIIN